MNILLINPPRSPYNGILAHAPENAKPFIHKKLIGPPLGLLTVAAAVKDFAVTFLDLKGEYDLHPDGPDVETIVLGYLRKSEPAIVGVTFIASEFPLGMRIFDIVKRFDPAILTVAGGLHATACPEDFTTGNADIVVPGQAAYIFREIAQAVEQNRDLDTVPGIYIRKQNALFFTGIPSRQYDYAGKDFLMPKRSLVKPWISTYHAGNSPQLATYLFTSLGCPYQCTFCSIWQQFDGRFFQRDVESVVAELLTLDEYPVVRFADANTVVNEIFIRRLFDRIQEERIRKTFIMDIRFDTVVRHPALIETMAKNGLKVVICGFESFRQKELERYNKSASAHLIREAVGIFDANGILVRGNYVVPPDYTLDDFKALAEYAASFPVVYAGYTILTPMPKTPLYASMRDQIIDCDLAKYNFFNCVLKTTLPLEKFYEQAGALWAVKKGGDVI